MIQGSQTPVSACSFSGHRVIEAGKLAEVRDRLERAVAYAYGRGCRTFYAGGAIGFDTLAARMVLMYRITHPDLRLILLLPCIDQSEKWSDRAKDAYDFLLANADEVVYTADTYTKTCMKERNFALASKCDILICYVTHGASGASQTASFAKKMGKEVYNLA